MLGETVKVSLQFLSLSWLMAYVKSRETETNIVVEAVEVKYNQHSTFIV